ncbi:WXG100 family type VII secretion target [Rhodococcus marinonascens]|uniref:WXG100 family type VII secretion target n=1 Tax=Rhodococcus marinonascens TaxID=38311 RepID=UPI001114BD29|nr:WXG100 family type VII secretion target [Rhodococcus marinonascens]
MSPTVPEVIRWKPESLRSTAGGIDRIVAELDERFTGLMIEQDALADTWSGAAATAAATRVVQEKSLGGAVAGALSDVAEQCRSAAGIVDGARLHLVSVVSDARGRGFNVEDDGMGRPSRAHRLARPGSGTHPRRGLVADQEGSRRAHPRRRRCTPTGG